jgi:hypothetical protein
VARRCFRFIGRVPELGTLKIQPPTEINSAV